MRLGWNIDPKIGGQLQGLDGQLDGTWDGRDGTYGFPPHFGCFLTIHGFPQILLAAAELETERPEQATWPQKKQDEAHEPECPHV